MDRPDSEESSAKASVLGGPAKPPAAAGGAKMSILGGAPSPSPSPSITSLLGGVRRGATAGGAGGAGGAGEAEAQRRFAHVCAVCSQGFRTRSELKTHAATHNVAKQYLCSHPTCNLTFGLKHNRDRHEATQHGHNKTLRKRHAKPPAVYCEICNKKFRYPAEVRRHQVVHNGERLFKCDFCTLTFNVKGNLTRHMRIRHRDALSDLAAREAAAKEVAAAAAAASINATRVSEQAGAAAQAAIESEAARTYDCLYCGERFAYHGNLQRHVASKHGDVRTPLDAPGGRHVPSSSSSSSSSAAAAAAVAAASSVPPPPASALAGTTDASSSSSAAQQHSVPSVVIPSLPVPVSVASAAASASVVPAASRAAVAAAAYRYQPPKQQLWPQATVAPPHLASVMGARPAVMAGVVPVPATAILSLPAAATAASSPSNNVSAAAAVAVAAAVRAEQPAE